MLKLLHFHSLTLNYPTLFMARLATLNETFHSIVTHKLAGADS